MFEFPSNGVRLRFPVTFDALLARQLALPSHAFTHVERIWRLVLPTLTRVVVADALSAEVPGDADFATSKSILVYDLVTTLSLAAACLRLVHSSKVWVHTALLVLVALFISVTRIGDEKFN